MSVPLLIGTRLRKKQVRPTSPPGSLPGRSGAGFPRTSVQGRLRLHGRRPAKNKPASPRGLAGCFEESLAILRSLSGFSAALDWIDQRDRTVLLLLPINHHVFRSVVAERLHCVCFADAFLGTSHGHLLGARLVPGGDFDIGDTIELAERLTDVCFAAPSGDSGHGGNVLHLRVCRADIADQSGCEQAGDECDSGHGLLIWLIVDSSREGQRTARSRGNVHNRPGVATPEMKTGDVFAVGSPWGASPE